MTIERFKEDVHDVQLITELLHRAYKPLADAGMKYMATHQGPEITLDRLTSGHGFVILDHDGTIIGTFTVYPEARSSTCLHYMKDGVWAIGQFAIDTHLQKAGLGSNVMLYAEEYVRSQGGTALALDTSENAHHLIAYYTARGYEFVESIKWNDVNYRSKVFSKSLR